jgi:hypothetical protein
MKDSFELPGLCGACGIVEGPGEINFNERFDSGREVLLITCAVHEVGIIVNYSSWGCGFY